jgi:AhpC/TSA family protein
VSTRLPPGASRYTWFVGVLIVLLAATIMVNTLRTDEVATRGLAAGQPLPPFAAPLATGELVGDVNVDRRSVCRVRGAGLLNSCELAERGPAALAFVATRSDRCLRQLDSLEQVREQHAGVQVAAVVIRSDRDDVRGLVREHGWRFPVAYDRDGVLANVFGVAVCPQVTFALPGGRVTGSSVGELDAAALGARLGRLERRARADGWRP